MKPLLTLALLLTLAIPCRAERLVLVAGGGTKGDGAPADQAELKTPFGIGFDPEGALIFVELTGERVRKIDRDGIVTTIAGTGKKGNGGDGGPATKAEFNGMHSLAVAHNGDIYLADTWNNRIRKIDAATGIISNVAGTGKKGYADNDDNPNSSVFGGVYCVALLKSRNAFGIRNPGSSGANLSIALYVADLDNRRVRVVRPDNHNVQTVVGTGKKGVPVDDSEARKAPLVDPRAVAVDGQGKLYILERGGHALRVVFLKGQGVMIRTLAGTGKGGYSGDGGPAIKAMLNGPKHLCVDAKGNVYIADTDNHRIRLYDPADGTIRTIAGNGRKGKAGLNGSPTEAELNQPHGVAIGPDGFLYIADSHNNRILKIVP